MKEKIKSILEKFCKQAQTDNLRKEGYPREWDGFEMKVSFGIGQPARIPWIAFLSSEMRVTKGIYPVYLYYKNDNILILAYGISETEESTENWPFDIQQSSKRIDEYIKTGVPRYGNSFVFKAYKVNFDSGNVNFTNSEGRKINEEELDKDLSRLLNIYEGIIEKALPEPGLFYMEEQLESFLVDNWKNTELGKKYDLITEDGEIISRQFKTDVGDIDILAKDEKNNNYVVIELKKDKTSDKVIGQIAKYIGWIKKHKANGAPVKGIIITGRYDKKLDYALKAWEGINVDVYIYKVDFGLKEFSSKID